MSHAIIKNRIISTRVNASINDHAKANLAKQGLTVPEYIRLALLKAANDEVRLVSSLDSPVAMLAIKDAETDQLEPIGTLDDLGVGLPAN